MSAGRWLFILVFVASAAAPSGGHRCAAAADSIDLDPPPPGVFVLDHADLLNDADEAELQTLAATLHDEHRTPLLIVTIESMSDHWPYGTIRIETFAHLLFDQWQIGDAVLDGATWNTGILLLVSKRDRKARIQLGAGWKSDKDAECRRIMDRRIIPAFKRKQFGAGIRAGAGALDAMARGKPLPARATSGATPAPASRGISPHRHGHGGYPEVGHSSASFVTLMVVFVILVVIVVVVVGVIVAKMNGTGGDGSGSGIWAALNSMNQLSALHGRSGDDDDRHGGGFARFGGLSSFGGFSSGGSGGGGFSSGGGGGYSGGGGASGSW